MKYLLPFHTLLGANDPWTLKFYSSLGCAFFTLFVTLEYVISTLKSNGSLAGIRFFFSFSRFFYSFGLERLRYLHDAGLWLRCTEWWENATYFLRNIWANIPI